MKVSDYVDDLDNGDGFDGSDVCEDKNSDGLRVTTQIGLSGFSMIIQMGFAIWASGN